MNRICGYGCGKFAINFENSSSNVGRFVGSKVGISVVGSSVDGVIVVGLDEVGISVVGLSVLGLGLGSLVGLWVCVGFDVGYDDGDIVGGDTHGPTSSHACFHCGSSLLSN